MINLCYVVLYKVEKCAHSIKFIPKLNEIEIEIFGDYKFFNKS